MERIQCRNVFHHVASYHHWVLPDDCWIANSQYSTIYTVLKTVQEMSKHLQQSTAVITFDLAIYSKAKEIHWRYPEEFQNLVIRLGGFHIALNYLALIGKMFQESGLEDVFIESGLYGSSSTMALLQGKSYNRGIRGHKLIMEALLRLKWDAFCSWVSKGGGGDRWRSRKRGKSDSKSR